MLIKFDFLIEVTLLKMENNEKQFARFHLASFYLLIFYAKLLRFTFAGLFEYCISKLYYFENAFLFRVW